MEFWQRMKAAAALFLSVLTMMAGGALLGAETPPPPHAWATTSRQGHVVFKMVPASQEAATRRPHRASASTMGWDGGFTEIWSAEGWYGHEGFLSDNGRYFVRIGPGAGDAPGEADALITFYDRGRLLRQHSVQEVMKDATLPGTGAGTDRWRPQTQKEPNGFKEGAFHLVVAGGASHIFDPVTGREVATGEDVDRQRIFGLNSARRDALHLKGQAAYEASSFKQDYEKHFDAGFITPEDLFKTPDVWFEGPEWRVTFKLKKPYQVGFQIEIRAVFPWSEAGGISTSLTAEQIEAALQAVLAQPVIAGLGSAGKIHLLEMQITGDRLHASTGGLQEAMVALKLKAPAGIPVAWAEIRLDWGRESRRMFVNTQTGELIELHLPKPPTMYDVKGQEVKP